MKKANNDIRQLLKAKKISLWEIGEIVGRNEVTICRWLRTELSEEKRKKILDAIKTIERREIL